MTDQTTREQRAAIIKNVNANLAVDNLRPPAFSKKLDELYIAGKITNEQIIEALKKHYLAKQNQRKEGANNHD